MSRSSSARDQNRARRHVVAPSQPRMPVAAWVASAVSSPPRRLRVSGEGSQDRRQSKSSSSQSQPPPLALPSPLGQPVQIGSFK